VSAFICRASSWISFSSASLRLGFRVRLILSLVGDLGIVVEVVVAGIGCLSFDFWKSFGCPAAAAAAASWGSCDFGTMPGKL
jgi:hypothetical protein